MLLQKKAATLNKLEMVSEVNKHRSGEYRRLKKKYLSTKKSKMNVTKSLQEQKKIVSDMKQKLAGLQNLEKQYEDMKIRQKELCDRLRELEVQNSVLQEASTSIQTWVGNHSTAAFTDDVRKVCYFLVSKNVAAGNIGPVIKYTIETLAKKQISDLPGKSQVSNMVREAGKLSKLQVGETILEKENCTDGTSKGVGRHYFHRCWVFECRPYRNRIRHCCKLL